MIKAAFFDIDGTLISFKTHRIPDSTKQAITELKRKNIKIFIATGRPFFLINNLEDLKFDGFITLNGAYCINDENETIYKKSVSQDDVESLIRYQEKNEAFPCMFATKDKVFINYVDDNVEKMVRLINFISPDIMSLNDAMNEEIFQFMGFFGQEQEKEIMEKAFPNCTAARWNPLFADIVAKGSSKQTGIDELLKHYNINLQDVIAFGDGGNDIPMLKHTPLSIAMGNANEEVKKSATYITDNVDDDGIWNALKYFNVI